MLLFLACRATMKSISSFQHLWKVTQSFIRSNLNTIQLKYQFNVQFETSFPQLGARPVTILLHPFPMKVMFLLYIGHRLYDSDVLIVTYTDGLFAISIYQSNLQGFDWSATRVDALIKVPYRGTGARTVWLRSKLLDCTATPAPVSPFLNWSCFA